MRRPIRALLLATVALCLIGAAAQAESFQEGQLRISFDGGITPNLLPRSTPVPVTVKVAGGIQALGETRLPQLREITVAINKAGALYDKGVPVCKVKAIQPAEEEIARRVCGDSIIGYGHVTLVVRLPGQSDFLVRGELLAFNGPRRDGHKLILAQIYSNNPPGAFILSFKVTKHKGTYGTVISTSLPKYAENWAYLTSFEMVLGRTYTRHGHKQGYVSASCELPKGFTKASFPFAKAAYRFNTGKTLRVSIARTCKVAGK